MATTQLLKGRSAGVRDSVKLGTLRKLSEIKKSEKNSHLLVVDPPFLNKIRRYE